MDRGLARRQAFLEAARGVFLQHGYRAASVNEVVRIAGGSLATLYLQFGSKEGLFQACVQDQYARLTKEMAPESVDHLPLEEGLCAIGERFLSNLLKPETLAFHRLVVGQSEHFPEATRRDISAGAAHVREFLADYLRAHGLVFSESDSHPSMLLDLWRSRYHYRALVDVGFELSEGELKRHIAQCVEVFLNGARR